MKVSFVSDTTALPRSDAGISISVSSKAITKCVLQQYLHPLTTDYGLYEILEICCLSEQGFFVCRTVTRATPHQLVAAAAGTFIPNLSSCVMMAQHPDAMPDH